MSETLRFSKEAFTQQLGNKFVNWGERGLRWSGEYRSDIQADIELMRYLGAPEDEINTALNLSQEMPHSNFLVPLISSFLITLGQKLNKTR